MRLQKSNRKGSDQMGKADLHIHTTYSYDGTATVTATLEHVARNTDLDVIAITDHDEIDGALAALELAPHYGVEAIPGVEVSTAEGHVLALFVKKSVPRNLSLAETVLCVREQGGLCIAAHPGGRQPWCLKENAIACALKTVGVADTLLGVETYNASLPNGRRLALTPIGNSDAHMLWMIGMAATRFPGTDAASLGMALHNRTTGLVISARPAHFVVSYLKR
jgi:predicted metal-dependent phosphoesterase TrpH